MCWRNLSIVSSIAAPAVGRRSARRRLNALSARVSLNQNASLDGPLISRVVGRFDAAEALIVDAHIAEYMGGQFACLGSTFGFQLKKPMPVEL